MDFDLCVPKQSTRDNQNKKPVVRTAFEGQGKPGARRAFVVADARRGCRAGSAKTEAAPVLRRGRVGFNVEIG